MEDFPRGQVLRTKGFEVENTRRVQGTIRDSFDLLTCSRGFTARKTAGWGGGSQRQRKRTSRCVSSVTLAAEWLVRQNHTLAAIVFFSARRCATELQRTLSNANRALKECLPGSWERGRGCRVRQLPNVSVVPVIT